MMRFGDEVQVEGDARRLFVLGLLERGAVVRVGAPDAPAFEVPRERVTPLHEDKGCGCGH